MHRPPGGTADIVIPTGRNGFCCIVPCALMLALESGAAAAGLLLARHLLRRAVAHVAERSSMGDGGGVPERLARRA